VTSKSDMGPSIGRSESGPVGRLKTSTREGGKPMTKVATKGTRTEPELFWSELRVAFKSLR
jgi:hypothetical protein